MLNIYIFTTKWTICCHCKAVDTISLQPMAAILKNGGCIEILRGPRFFPEGYNLNDFHTYLFR